MAGNRNQGNNQGQGNNTPKVPIVTCPKCSKDVPKGKLCNECGYKFEVECPSCKKTVLNKTRCYECGAELGKKPAAPKAQEKFDMEVTPTVKDGKGSVRIQVTKDGKEVQSTVWVGISGNQVKCYSFGKNVPGKGGIFGGSIKPSSAQPGVSVSSCSCLQTDDKGFLELVVNFDGQAKAFLAVALVGTQVDLKKSVALSGPRFTFSPVSGGPWQRVVASWDQFWELRSYNQNR